jgi:hypothetical protein
MNRRSAHLGLSLALVFLSACTRSPPPIAKGVPLSIGPSPAFSTRLHERFPSGTSINALLDELRSEGFVISSDAQGPVAMYKVSNFPCGDTWTIRWAGEAEKIASITGQAIEVCL